MKSRTAALRRAAALVVLTTALAACAAQEGQEPSLAVSAPAASLAPSEPTEPGEGEFVNPVLAENFPDPGVIEVDGVYYAYATEDLDRGEHIQAARSADLVSWERLPDAVPELPSWAVNTSWAPEVMRTDAGLVMYYTSRWGGVTRPDAQSALCIAVAVSEAPEGPFENVGEEPIVCQPDLGGTIDPFPFTDADGSRYLVFKNDGNCCRIPTRFFIQPLAADGLSVTGEATELGLQNDAPWEGRVIEGPTLLAHDGRYYLFFSANDYASAAYAVGYASADSVMGPYADAEENPILATPERDERDEEIALGPGGQSIVEAPGGDLWMLYHAWNGRFTERRLWLDELRFEDGRPVVDGPDSLPQPVPD